MISSPTETASASVDHDRRFDLVAALMRWAGPGLIVLGMIYGAVYLVDTDVFGPPERLAAGIVVTAGFGWLGQWFVRRGQGLLGELVTGTSFAGAFLCSWAVPAVTGWSAGVSILLSGIVGLAALGYSWSRQDSTTFTIGVWGVAGIPISGPLYGGEEFADTVENIYRSPQMLIPLVLFAVLALGARVVNGWFVPWASTITAVFVAFVLELETGGSLGVGLLLTSVVVISSLFGVTVGEGRDNSTLERYGRPIFAVVDAASPLLALLPFWLMLDWADLWSVGESVLLGLWAALCAGLGMSLYRGVSGWRVERSSGRMAGAFLSALVAVVLAIGDLEWYVYVVLAGALFVLSVANDPGRTRLPVKASGVEESAEPGPVGLRASVSTPLQVVFGFVNAVGLLMMIGNGIDGALYRDIPLFVSAWVSVGLFGAGFALRAALHEWWMVPYGFALAMLAAGLGGQPGMLLLTSGLWLVTGLVVVKIAVDRRARTGVVVGLSTMAVAVGKVLLVDLGRFDSDLLRALALLISGLIVVLISSDIDRIKPLLFRDPVSADE